MSSLTPPQPPIIVFLVLPATMMTLSSPILRQILSASKKVLSSFTESQIVFEFVPEQFIINSMEKSLPYDSALDLLSSSVYNRILVPVDRTMSRRIHEHGEPTRSFMSPTFTLSRSLCNKVSYVRAAHTSLDVMDRYTLLHVAYHLTACGKWILASCVDQRGEAYDLGVWLTQSPGASDGEPEVSNEEYAVRKVWDFAMQFAKKANVEWRVVFARLGVMNKQEMSGKRYHSFSMLFSHDFFCSMDNSAYSSCADFSRTASFAPQCYVCRTRCSMVIHSFFQVQYSASSF